MANIEKIRVGETDYNIRVPDGSSLSLSSLTVTGNLTVSGTANLSVVNCESISVSRIDCLSGIRLVQLGDFPGSAKSSYTRFLLTSPEAEAEYPGSPAQINIGTMNGTASTRASIRLVHSDGSITISSGSSITFNQGGSQITLPNKAGTIALLDDVPEAVYLFNGEITFSGGNVQSGRVIVQFLHEGLDIFQEGGNLISSATNFDILVSHLRKGGVQIATGTLTLSGQGVLNIYGITYDNTNGFTFFCINSSGERVNVSKNQNGVSLASGYIFATKILGTTTS